MDEKLASWSRERGRHAKACISCGGVPVPGRRLCKECRAEREVEARQRRIATNIGKPCVVDDCEEPRVVTASQASSYCRKHKNMKAAETRNRTRPRERFEERSCEACGQHFQWRSTHPSQRFCSKECYTQGILDERKLQRYRSGLIENGMRWCGTCKKHLDLEDFAPSRRVEGSPAICRACSRDAQRRYQEKHKDKYREVQRLAARKRRFRDVYGISMEFFEEVVERQASVCALCGDKTELVPDHCHNGGGFRGAICGRCNTGLGMFRDNPEAMRAAIAYLEQQ